MKILVTGAAGFIGSKLAYCLAKRGDEVIGIDNINTYYNPNLKYGRLKEFFGIDIDSRWDNNTVIPETGNGDDNVTFPEMPFREEFISHSMPNFRFIRMDIVDRSALFQLFQKEKFDKVMNLAAQAGVRYSIKNPYAYIESNVMGFMNILECCHQHKIKHLVYASSSSVYGGNTKIPFAENDRVDNQVSIYAATKKSNELMANVYSVLYALPTTGLRFFTVYGPWGRPDMAPMLFTNAILKNKPIKVFNNGNLSRDFTYIDDIVEGVMRVIDKASSKEIPSEVYNIGCGHPIPLMDFIHTLEAAVGKKAKMEMLPMQQGDVCITYADTNLLFSRFSYTPGVHLNDGISEFVNWYKRVII